MIHHTVNLQWIMVCLSKDLQITFLFLCLLIISGCSWKWSTRRTFWGLNHDEEHVPPSVIMRGTSPSRLNLFVMFFLFFFFRVFCASKGQTQCCFSGAACQHESLSSGAEKCIQSMSKVTNTALPLTVCRKQEGSYTCKIQAEILVEHGESLQEAAVTFHRSNLQNASSSIWLRSENQSWTLLKLYVSATAVGSDKSC